MLYIKIPDTELWDEKIEQFVTIKGQTLQLEHSLVSISKWESRWKKPFLTKEKKTIQETIDYIRCMTITQNVNEEVYVYLTNENVQEVKDYIESTMTATYFLDNGPKSSSREKVTAELIYYWMISLGIPFECQKWHLDKLLTLIQVCNIKNQPSKKMSKKDIMSRNAALNAIRRKQLNTEG